MISSRSTPRGASCSTPTIRPAARSPRPASTPDRRPRYANAGSLGQAFNFDLFEAGWNIAEFRAAIENGLRQAAGGSSSTWTLSNHDAVRHATRFGLPDQDGLSSQQGAKAWVTTDGREPPLDAELGLRRARAAILLELALPGAAYLYQGEELGLGEVADIPWRVLEDPIPRRSGGREKGRDGCRVPLPWTRSGPSYGFGAAASNLPQPSWFADAAVEVQGTDPMSTLNLYRRALSLRRRLLATEDLTWRDDVPGVLHLARPGGWHSVTNFSSQAVPLPPGELLIVSAAGDPGRLPVDATAWVRQSGS